MWQHLSTEWKSAIVGILLGTLLVAFGPGRSHAAERPADVFTLFDKGVVSLIANTSCGIDDPKAFERFAEDFSKVASVVSEELQRMNPERTASEIDMLVGFRVAQLELKTEGQVKKAGCNAPEVKATRALFDVSRQLAFIEGDLREYSH